MEEWKDIKGYEGLYQVSSEGKIRSLGRYRVYKDGRRQYWKGRNLIPWKAGKGYLQVSLWNGDKERKTYIHQIVAETFIPNPLGLKKIAHKDSNRTNNRADNLGWV